MDGGRTDPLSYEPFVLAMSKCPTRETTKEVSDQTMLETKHCKSYWSEIDMIQRGQDVASYVGSLWSQALAF